MGSDDDGMMQRPVSVTLSKSKTVKFELVPDFKDDGSDDDEDNMLNMMDDDDNLSMNDGKEEDVKHE